MGSHFILFWPFRVFKGKTKPKLGLYTKNIEKKEKKNQESEWYELKISFGKSQQLINTS